MLCRVNISRIMTISMYCHHNWKFTSVSLPFRNPAIDFLNLSVLMIAMRASIQSDAIFSCNMMLCRVHLSVAHLFVQGRLSAVLATLVKVPAVLTCEPAFLWNDLPPIQFSAAVGPKIPLSDQIPANHEDCMCCPIAFKKFKEI